MDHNACLLSPIADVPARPVTEPNCLSLQAHHFAEQKPSDETWQSTGLPCRLPAGPMNDPALFSCDLKGRVTRWNPGAEKLFGFSANEILGQALQIIYPNDKRASARVAHGLSLALKEGLRIDERWLVRKDGTRLYVLEELRPAADQAGCVYGFTEVALDLTDRKKIEVELRRSCQRLETALAERTAKLLETTADLQACSYSLGHDLRAPLRAMQGFSEIVSASETERLSPRGKEFFNKIMSAARRFDGLIQDLLALNHIGVGPLTLESINLDCLLQDILERHHGLQPPMSQVCIAHPLLPVIGHRGLVSQCLSNLLDNAVKFISPTSKPKVKVWTESLGNQVRIWVQDNGIGIEPQYHEKVFGIFQRLHPDEKHYEGRGIGLAVVRKAARCMRGEVGIQAHVHRGSRFWLQLPGAHPL
jgi:PAS domain S-box-containing protein